MMETESSKIWHERNALEKERRDKQRDLMKEYDREVYYPSMKALRERCSIIGHRPQAEWHYNGLGWMRKYCNQCGSICEISGPDETEIDEATS